MARSEYVYVVTAGNRRDHVIGTFTVKREMVSKLRVLYAGRQDLSVRRHRDGEFGAGTIMLIDELLA